MGSQTVELVEALAEPCLMAQEEAVVLVAGRRLSVAMCECSLCRKSGDWESILFDIATRGELVG